MISRASGPRNGLPMLVESVSSEVRAMLALFCYRRSHLHSLAFSIAARCSERDLIQLAGRVGSTLYALSRPASTTRSTPSASYGNRKPITLSTKPLSTFSPVKDDVDEEDLRRASPHSLAFRPSSWLCPSESRRRFRRMVSIMISWM
jgi:hypothetical protein